ncbi:MAG: tetratricopeptide repeat protein [Saprospiraceae bacterium]|nr:tetratricopeptide repeat protein [Saprospiraceae bacterium]
MKKLLFTLLLILPFQGFTQIEKAVKPVASPLPAVALAEAGAPSSAKATAGTRAVVIGISDYQDPQIPDLRFADADANAFANFLRSPAGGSLDGDHLKVLLNSEATVAQFDAALGWLMDESKPGDQAIIYFSGHGDVETKTRNQHGFLLCWDSPPQSYISGAYPIFFLKDVITTLSTENKARVLIITDACRSGKLAGNSIGGAQLTSQNLAQQFANEIKILSCQPDEYSLEGEQWGGGRGAFSFHLVDGLYGLADGNSDGSVNLMEIGRHLEDHVTPEVSPQSQVPMTVGNRTEKLAAVFPDLLAQVKKNKTGQLPLFSATDSRGIEDEVLATVDSTIRALYYRFKKALKEKVFLEPPGECADAYYLRLMAEPKLERLHNSMRRNYAAALQDDAQQAINNLMKMERTETRLYRLERLKKYAPYPRLLERAAELLGPEHYMYQTLQARKFYFEGAVLQMESPLNPDSVLGQRILDKYRASLSQQPDAALTYRGISEVFEKVIPNIDSMAFYGYKAIEASPNWIRAYTKLGWMLTNLKRFGEAQILLEKALTIDSSEARTWGNLGWLQNRQGNLDASEACYLQAIAVDSTYEGAYFWLGSLYFNKGKMNESIGYFLKAVQADKPSEYTFNFLGCSYSNIGQYAEAEKYFLKGLEIEPNGTACLVYLAGVYLKTQRMAEAKDLLTKALAYDSSIIVQGSVAEVFHENGLYPEAEDLLQKILAKDSLDEAALWLLASNKLKSGRMADAEALVKKCISINPKLYWNWELLGQVYLKLARYEEARQSFFKGMEMDPDNSIFYSNLAILYAVEGKTNAALNFAEQAFQKGMAWETIYEFQYFDFAPVRRLPGFKKLEKKYFPDK